MNKGSFRKRSGVTSSIRFGEGLDTVKKKEAGCSDEVFARKVSVDEEPLGHGFFSRTLHGSLRRRTRKGGCLQVLTFIGYLDYRCFSCWPTEVWTRVGMSWLDAIY